MSNNKTLCQNVSHHIIYDDMINPENILGIMPKSVKLFIFYFFSFYSVWNDAGERYIWDYCGRTDERRKGGLSKSRQNHKE